MKRDLVKEYMKENRKKSLAGTLGPELDEEVRQRVIAKAKRYAAEQQQAEWEEREASRARRRRFRPAVAVLMVACLLVMVPMFAFGNKSNLGVNESIILTSLPDDYHFFLESNEYPLQSMQQLGNTINSYYSLPWQNIPLSLIEIHNNTGGFTLIHSNDPNGYEDSVAFYDQTIHYYVDRDGVSGYIEFKSQKCLLKILAPSCTEEQFLDIVSHIQMQ